MKRANAKAEAEERLDRTIERVLEKMGDDTEKILEFSRMLHEEKMMLHCKSDESDESDEEIILMQK